MSNPSVELKKFPSKLEPQLWAPSKSSESSQSHFSVLRPRPPRLSWVSFTLGNSSLLLACARPSALQVSLASARSADAAGSRRRCVGRFFHVERALREDWVVAVAAAEAVLVPARASTGRAGTALRGRIPPRKLFRAAARVCELVREVGGDYTPHLHGASLATRTPSGFFCFWP